jgi:hypothetical protein
VPRRRSKPIGCWIVLALLVVTGWFGWREYQRMVRQHPERFPWTELSLDDPVGRFTGIKLAALTDDGLRCRALLRSAKLAEVSVSQGAIAEPRCRFDDGVKILPEREESVDYAPAGLVTSCPVAAALALWERDVVQPAAARHLGKPVRQIDHAGSSSCRRLYGRPEGPFSEHATADAIDISGFRIEGGRRISVLRTWRSRDAEATFLHDVRDGACDLFSTVLSPDYNAAHADHLHFDLAERGAVGWRLCR